MGQTGGETGGETDRQWTDRKNVHIVNGETDKQIDGQKSKQTE